MNRMPQFQDVKLYIGITASDDDALLAFTLRRAVATFENLCGRSFQLEATAKFFSADGEEVLSWSTLFPRNDDIYEITEVEIDGQVVPSDEYFIDGRKIRLKTSSDFSFKGYTGTPENSIKVTGRWGYSETIPDDVFGAIVRLSAWLYQQKDNAMDLDRPVAVSNAMLLPAALPSDVLEIAKMYKRLL